jgi:hypothetical protein
VPDATPSSPPPAKDKKKKKSAADVQRELRDLTKGGPDKPPIDMKKIYVRVGLVVGVAWIIAFIIPTWVPKAVVGALTLVVIGAGIWVVRYMKKGQALGALLKDADTEEGRKRALERLETDFGKGDTQALLAKAQLEMQEDPRKALGTLESIDLGKQLAPIAGQVRAMRAMLHLTLGEPQEARMLADQLDLGKQQEAKTRAMFATVASEAWARTGNAKKAVETLELFNPEDPEFAELRPQMWRARAFAYAGANDMKGASRALKKLGEMNPHLLAMFIGAKRVHPLLEREAKQIVMKLGAVPRKVVRQRM